MSNKKRKLESITTDLDNTNPPTKKPHIQEFEVSEFDVKCIECDKKGSMDRKLWIDKKDTQQWIFCRNHGMYAAKIATMLVAKSYCITRIPSDQQRTRKKLRRNMYKN